MSVYKVDVYLSNSKQIMKTNPVYSENNDVTLVYLNPTASCMTFDAM